MTMTIDGTNGITFPNATTQALGAGLTLTASQASTSGTNIDFTSIPSWVERVTVMFNGVSTNGSSEVTIQLGTASGFTSSGYLGTCSTTRDAVSPGVTNYSTGFLIRFGGTAGTAAAVRHGVCTFTSYSGNTWVGHTAIGLSSLASNSFGAGLIALAGALTQIRITTENGTDAFDAGSLNIMYEG